MRRTKATLIYRRTTKVACGDLVYGLLLKLSCHPFIRGGRDHRCGYRPRSEYVSEQ